MWFCCVLFFLKCISKEHSFDKYVYFNRNWSEIGREGERERERETERERELRKKKERQHTSKLNKHYTPSNSPE
jgi:hypothetical protein